MEIVPSVVIALATWPRVQCTSNLCLSPDAPHDFTDRLLVSEPPTLDGGFSPLFYPEILESTEPLLFDGIGTLLIKFDDLPTGEVFDLTSDYFEWLVIAPEIVEFDVSPGIGKAVGKCFETLEQQPTQLVIEEESRSNENCKHGIRKEWCATCKKQRQERVSATQAFDVFDLVFPILLPPIDGEFAAPFALPPGKTLYPFQRAGVDFLIKHERALLAADMGLGKSIQAIVALKILFRMGRVIRCLIVCPKAVQTDWRRKLELWSPEFSRIINVSGASAQRRVQWETDAHVKIVTYETLRQDLPPDDAGSVSDWANNFDVVILDEAQKIKNPRADVTQAIKKHLDAKMRWALTGTPLENKLDDVVSIFSYIKPWQVGYDMTAAEVRMRIEPYMLRRRKQDALPELPEKVLEETWLELTPQQRHAYDQAEREGKIDLTSKGETITITHVLQLITKLKQICNLHPDENSSCKADFLAERLEVVRAGGDKALVFSQFPNITLARLKGMFEEFGPLLYDGSLSQSKRDQMLETFDASDANTVLLLSVRSGGTGLTITRANYVFHYDLWWNPAVARQAEDRAHRIGQEKQVFVNSLLTENTIEERIHRLLAEKQRLFNFVIDEISDTNWADALTEEELFGLLDLTPPRKRHSSKVSRPPEHIDFTRLTPLDFEQLTGRLYEAMGYSVRFTPQSRDGGVDVYATRQSASGRDYIAVQCKHMPNSKVGRKEAQALYGVIGADQSITKGALVTTGDFSSDCRNFVEGKRLELINGGTLLGLLHKFEVAYP